MHRQQHAGHVPAVLATPEGSWPLSKDRRPAAVAFNPDLATRLAVAQLRRGTQPGVYLVWSLHCTVFVYSGGMDERDPLRRIDFRSGSASPGNPAGYVTSLDFSPDASDGYDLLVGMSNGEIKVLSLAAQLAATHANTKPISALTFNQESNASEASRCTAAVWIPGSHGAVFASAHANGAVLLHQKIVGSSSDSKLLARSSPDQGSRAPPVQLRPPGGPGATALAASPLGKLLAVGSRDGTLALLELPSGKVIGGFKSYYGGILCATWSADGRYVAAGGEDDLVAVWSMAEGAVVAHCEGHASWVSGVAFDRYGAFAPFSGRSNTAGSAAAEGRYRLASVGQDCHVLLWDLGLGEPSLGTSSRGSSARSPIAASVPRAEMTLLAPVTQSKVHYEPLCDVVFLEDALVAAGHDGTVKRWRRPEAMPMADETEDIEPMAVE